MKTKPMIMTHGNLILPLTVGQKARYCQNGIWKTTGRVRQIIEQTEDYVNSKQIQYGIVLITMEEKPMFQHWWHDKGAYNPGSKKYWRQSVLFWSL